MPRSFTKSPIQMLLQSEYTALHAYGWAVLYLECGHLDDALRPIEREHRSILHSLQSYLLARGEDPSRQRALARPDPRQVAVPHRDWVPLLKRFREGEAARLTRYRKLTRGSRAERVLRELVGRQVVPRVERCLSVLDDLLERKQRASQVA